MQVSLVIDDDPTLLEVIGGTIRLTTNFKGSPVVNYWTNDGSISVLASEFAQHAVDSRKKYGDEVADFLIMMVKKVGHAVRLQVRKKMEKDHKKRHQAYETRLQTLVCGEAPKRGGIDPTTRRWVGLTNRDVKAWKSSAKIKLKNFLVDLHMDGLMSACDQHNIADSAALARFLED